MIKYSSVKKLTHNITNNPTSLQMKQDLETSNSMNYNT